VEVTLQPALAVPATPRPAERPRPLRLWVAVLFAALAGLAMLASFPPYGLSWLAPVAVALLAAAAHRRRLRGGLGVGLIAGLLFFVPLLDWTHIAAGWLPWALLSGAQAGFFALLACASAWLSPVVDRWRALWPLLTGLLWVTQEAVRDRAPFGGFPWGRLGFGQSDMPALRVAVLGGAPLVTFVVAVTGGILVALLWRRWSSSDVLRRSVLPAAGYLIAGALLVGGPALIPAAKPGATTKVVAIVQGNVPRLGLDFNAQREAVLENHVAETKKLAADVAAGRRPKPDLVVWPENSSDIDPLLYQDAAQRIADAATTIGVPILVGAVLQGDKPHEIKNAAILWNPVTGPDLSQEYLKRHPVPFAEYMPLRSIAEVVSDRAQLVQNMVAGDRPGVIRTGPAILGDVICFEVAYDGIVRDTVTGGAQLLSVQTNNATFNDAEARQQLAMVQERAVEHGRESLMVSTVGVSAFVDTSGEVIGATSFNTPAVVVREMHLGGPRTLATRLGSGPEMAAVGLALVALAGAWPLRRRRYRGAGGETTDEFTTEER
jgi:apolipoprotein N-acyltransferase